MSSGVADMKRIILYSVSAILSVCLWHIHASLLYAQESVILNDVREEYPIGLHLEYLEDPTGELTFEYVSSEECDDRFMPSKHDVLNFGRTISVYWVRFHVRNEARPETQWRLEQAFANMHYITLYRPGAPPIETGMLRPFQTRDVAHPNLIFKLPSTRESYTIYLRFHTESSMTIDLHIWSADKLAEITIGTMLKTGMLFGIVLIMIGYNGFLWLSLNEKSYLYYVLFLLFVLISISMYSGVARQFLVPNHPLLTYHVTRISLLCIGLFGLSFATSFLETSRRMPKTHTIITLLKIFMLVYMMIPRSSASILPFIFTILAFSCMLFVGFMSWLSGYRPARYYVFAWSSGLITGIIFSLLRLGYLPSNTFTEESFKIGLVSIVFFLSLALADRINILKEAHAAAQQNALEASRKNEQLVHEQNIILEQKVEERTAELMIAKDKALEAQNAAEVANQAKSTFLANMSHELRSPLNAILGFAQVMARDGHTGRATLPPDYHDNLSIIRRSGEHLLTLINQVLDLSKIEAGRTTVNPQNFDLHRLLHDVQDMFALKADTKGLHLLFEQDESIPRYVRTDDVKLRQVLINLLNNAVKFTTEGGVAVKVTSHQSPVSSLQTPDCPLPTAHLFFEVSDTGPGIAAEEMDKVFEAFGQTETGRQSQEGTGLGLPISRKFVQLMGGDMRVKSRGGHGTLFAFDIQAQVVEASELVSHVPTRRVMALAPGQPRYRILVVDDRRINRQLVIKLLNPLGFELREAVNGQEAIDLWKAWKPHLIWMDMRMPVLDGYEATKRLKAMMSGKETAIIALTASSLEEERAVVLNAGCDDYLRKPFREADLFELMSKHIGVKFVYEEEGQKAQGKGGETAGSVTPETLAALPVEWIAQLKQGVDAVDVELISSAIMHIRGRNVDLADALARLAENFEYDEILAAIQKMYDMQGRSLKYD